MKKISSKMVKLFMGVLLFCLACGDAQKMTQSPNGELPSFVNESVSDQNFNGNWLFSKGQVDAESVSYDDRAWQKVTLPHDYAISGPFSNENDARTGGLPITGTAWYRKHFIVDAKFEGKRVAIEFEGAMANAQVWLNGEFVGKRPYGYIGFEFDITDKIVFGKENLIAVRLNQEDFNHRWYPGAGLYRNVRIKYNNPVHIPIWGTTITTPVIIKDKASVHIETQIVNAGSTESQGSLFTKMLDGSGKVVGHTSSEITIEVGRTVTAIQRMTLDSPRKWDIDDPYLYSIESEVVVDGKVVDVLTTEFGVRTIQFTPNDGFRLNGRRVELKGVCLHHDLGPLGAAVNYRAIERRMQIMQEMGVNALRTSHNPPAKEVLQICDRLGIVVIVEAFDEWKKGKVKNGYHRHFDEWHERDLRDMIKRDRNHPSVIMWSIGNEVQEQWQEGGGELAKRLSDIALDEDPTRLTTSGFNRGPEAYEFGLAQNVGVVGFNYHPFTYADTKEKYPDVILLASETSSQTSSRGIYHLPIEPTERRETGQISSYDATRGTSWTYPPDIEFQQLARNPFVLGEFMWTGFDYLGEPTPYHDSDERGYQNVNWPSRSSYFAPVDLVGLPKDRFYLYQSQWSSKPMVHVLPHWNWEGKKGDLIPVYSYTNGQEVELFVNGKSYGKKVKGVDTVPIFVECFGLEKTIFHSKYRVSWEVPYEPGTLKVVAYKDGKAIASKEVRTSGKPAALKLEADRKSIQADGLDLSYLTVIIVDKDGIPVPDASNAVGFEVDGVGFNAGVGNGDPRSTRTFKGAEMEAFSGKLVLIVQSNGEVGQIKVRAQSTDLETAELTIHAGG